ncbi:MAG TPA: EamA family transporter RarD [Anaerolineales bacterium]
MRINKGVLFAAGAYGLWGIIPIYFKILHQVPAFQIVAHRVIWSFVFLILLVAVRRQFPAMRSAITPRTVLIFLISGILLTVNWTVYVWAVNSGFIVEASLGYFINPLVNVLLGVVFLHEKLRPTQWIPVGLAAIGVAYLTFAHGSLPWIGLVLAFSFGMYGLIRKIAPLGSLFGLTLETGLILLPALGYLLWQESQSQGAFGHVGLTLNILLALAGLVTSIPLLLFASGARSVPLTTMGLLQYLTPTLQFLVGIVLYNEALTPARLIGFSIIWLALIVFSAENLLTRRAPVIQTA